MSPAPVAPSRHATGWHGALGATALCLLAGSLANWLRHLKPPESRPESAVLGATVGLMMVVTLLAFRQPFRSVGWLLLAVPLLNVARKWVAIDEGSATVPASVLLWALTAVLLLRTRPTTDGVAVAGLGGPLLVYVVVGFSSAAAAWAIGVPESRALASAITGVLEPAAILYLTYLCVRLGHEARWTVIGLVYGSAGCVALWSVLYFFGAGETPHGGALDDPGVVRSLLGSMTFGNTLHFSLAALVAVPLAFLDEAHPSAIRRVLRPTVLTLLLLGLGVGFSRGALLALAFEFFLLVRFRLVSRRLLFAFLPLVALAFMALFGGIVVMRMAESGWARGGDLSTGDISRLEAWRVAATSILHYPLGVGGGNFDFAWRRWSGFTVLFQEIGGPHNLWLSVGSEYGVPFLLLFTGVVFRLLRAAAWLAARAASSASRRLGGALFAALAGFLVAGSVGDAELSHLTARNKPMNTHALVLFSALGLIAAQRQSVGEGRSPAEESPSERPS